MLVLILLFFRSGCDQSSSNQTFASIDIQITIVYPVSCGQSQPCKEKFLVDVQIRIAAYTVSFFLSLTFANGRSIGIEVILCKSIIDLASSPSTISSTVPGKVFNGSTITLDKFCSGRLIKNDGRFEVDALVD
jgi:hypothetical protein